MILKLDFLFSGRVIRIEMKKLRPYFSLVAVVLVTLAGAWLAVPRDICLTKLVGNSGCDCVAEINTSSDCSCCATVEVSKSEGQNSDSNHAPGCFSISSQDIKLISPDRSHDAVAMDQAVAVIPISELLVDSLVQNASSIWQTGIFLSCGQKAYRNNCVFLI